MTKKNVNAGLVSNVSPGALSLAPLGPQGRSAVLLAEKRFARSLIFEAQLGWKVVDQYQAANPRSSLAAAAACSIEPGAAMTIITHDTARERLNLLSRQADGTYRVTREIEIGPIKTKKILTGNFGGQAPVSLLVCGVNKLIRIPLTGQVRQLRKTASFEPDIKGGRFGALTVGEINRDGCPDVLLCEQAKHHVEILTFNPQAKLVVATKFKVFEQPGGTERAAYGQDKRTGTQPRAVAVGDVTNDGKDDLILLVHDRLLILPQD